MVFGRSMGKLRAPRVNPGGQPVGSYIRRGIGKLPYQDHRCRVIKMIEVLIIVRIFGTFGVSVRQQNCFQPTMRAEARLKSVVCWVADVRRVVWAHGKK